MGRGCRVGVRARKEGVKRLSQWKLTTRGELGESWSGLGGGERSLGEFKDRDSSGAGTWGGRSESRGEPWPQRARRGVPSATPVAPPPQHPHPRPPALFSMRAAEGRPGGGGRQWDRRAGRIVGRARLRGGPSARCQCITCSSGPSPGQRGAGGGGGIKERVRLCPGLGGGGGALLGRPGPGRVRGAEGAPATTVAGSAVRRCPSGFAKAPEPFSRAEVAGVPRRDGTAKDPGLGTLPEGENCDPASTWSFMGHVPGAASAASSRETAPPNLVPRDTAPRGSERPAVPGQPQWGAR